MGKKIHKTKKQLRNIKKHLSRTCKAKKYHGIYGRNTTKSTIREPVALFL